MRMFLLVKRELCYGCVVKFGLAILFFHESFIYF
jgi:hypothetical protein